MSGYHEVEMKVEKRDGSLENISFDKILARVKKLEIKKFKCNLFKISDESD